MCLHTVKLGLDCFETGLTCSPGWPRICDSPATGTGVYQHTQVGHHPSLPSVAVINIMAISNLGRKGFTFLTCPDHSPQWKGVKAGARRQGLKQKPYWLTQPAFLYHPGPQVHSAVGAETKCSHVRSQGGNSLIEGPSSS